MSTVGALFSMWPARTAAAIQVSGLCFHVAYVRAAVFESDPSCACDTYQGATGAIAVAGLAAAAQGESQSSVARELKDLDRLLEGLKSQDLVYFPIAFTLFSPIDSEDLITYREYAQPAGIARKHCLPSALLHCNFALYSIMPSTNNPSTLTFHPLRRMVARSH